MIGGQESLLLGPPPARYGPSLERGPRRSNGPHTEGRGTRYKSPLDDAGTGRLRHAATLPNRATPALVAGRVQRTFHDAYSGRDLEHGKPLGTVGSQTYLELCKGFRLAQHDPGSHDATHDRVRLTRNHRVDHALEIEDHGFDLCRENLVAADVDDLALATQNSEPPSVDFDSVARVEESLLVEGTWRVEVPEHRRLRADPEPTIDDLGLEAIASDSYPERSRLPRFRAEDPDFGEPIGLLKGGMWQRTRRAFERRRRHWLGAIRDEA